MPADLRIAFLIDNLLRAGTQKALQHLVAGLGPRGFAIRVYCLNDRADPDVVADLEGGGAAVGVVGRRRLASGLGILALYRDFRVWRPDIVQTFLPVSDVAGRIAARLARVPVVVTSIRARNVDKAPLLLWLDRRTMRLADKVVFNARSVVPFALAHEGVREEQVVVIPNGVRTPGAERREGRRGEGIVIGTVGRLKPQKGIETLIRAFAILREAFPAELWIIGEGDQRPALETAASRLGVAASVRFLGLRKDVPASLRRMDVYAHPAVFEGMPNALMEAMAAGLPVVATDVDGARELITEGETGWLVPPNDPQALAARLAAVLAAPEQARRVGRAAAAHMAESFSVERMADRFEKLYRDLAATV